MLVVRILQPKRIGNSIEHRKQACHVDRFSDLFVRPTRVADLLYTCWCRSPGMRGHQFNELHQDPVPIIQPCPCHITFLQRLNYRVVFSLQLQKIAVRTNSVVALIQSGNERRDHFLGSTREVPVAKMQGIGQIEHAS